MKDLGLTLANISIACLIINVIIFFFNIKKWSITLKVLGIYLCLNLITEFFANILSYHFKQNNLPLLHFYTLLEFIVWTIFYKSIFIDNKKFIKIIPWFIGIISIIIITNSAFFEPISGFNSNAKTLVQLILIGYSVYYFFDAFGKIDLTKPTPRALTIINFAIILYYSGSLFIFMFSKLLTNQGIAESHQYGFWVINAILLIVFQILISISLWTVAFQKTKY